MRCFILTTLLLTLPGCSIENPLFGVGEDTAGSSEADTAASATPTGEPVTTTEPTAATSVTTGSEPATTGTDPDTTTGIEPATSTGDPDTTTGAQSGTSDPVDSSSTGIEPEPVCPAINEAFAPYLLKNGQPLAQCPGPEIYIQGRLAIGDPLTLAANVDCAQGPNDVYTLGTGLALPQGELSGCLKTQLRLVDTLEGCKISLIKSYDPGNQNALHLAAAFSAYADGLPIQPQANNTSYCGCAEADNNGPDCCAGLDPGELILLPTDNLGIMVEQFSHATVTLVDNGPQFEFYNLQSWVGPECMIGPEEGRHIDWIAVLKQ